MKRAVVLLAVAMLAGCMSAPMSSVSTGARPSHVLQNGNGTTTFEFLFPNDSSWDKDLAMQRISEYLATYARFNGFSGYDTISGAVQLLAKPNEVSAGMDILADAAAGNSRDAPSPGQAKFVRVIEQVRFRT